MRTSKNTSRTVFWGLAAALFILVILIAKANALTFPFPNEDEGAFFIPAWSLAVHGTLKPEMLNAPNGIYWMPQGYYVWLSIFLWLFGPTIEVARTVNQATTAAAVALLTLANARISRSRVFAAICALLLVSPAVIISANTIRMESLIFLLYAIAVLLHSYRRYLLAGAALALSLLVHPALMLAPVLYMAAVAFLHYKQRSTPAGDRRQWIRRFDVVICALVLAAIVAEATLVSRHMDLFRQHMAFQVHRKAMRSLSSELMHKRGMLLLTEILLVGCGLYVLRRHAQALQAFLKESGPVVFVALGLQAYATVGYEGPYAIYSYAIVPATLFCAAYGAISILSQSAEADRENSARTASAEEFYHPDCRGLNPPETLDGVSSQ